jgi:hypothetical protein
MDSTKVGFIGLIMAQAPATYDWIEVVKSFGILGLFAYYIFVHEPRRAEADHKRRIEELNMLKDLNEKEKE